MTKQTACKEIVAEVFKMYCGTVEIVYDICLNEITAN